MREVVIVDGSRTPIGHFGKALKNVPAVELGALAIKETLKRAKLKPDLVEDVIMGAIHQEGMGNNPARIASLKAGIPPESGALTINNVCSSGMKGVELAYDQIKLGKKDIVIAGGMESNSQCPYMLINARWGYRLGNAELVDALYYDGFTDTYACYGNYDHIGETAENILANAREISKNYNLSEINLDFNEINEFALSSHKKYFKALKEHFFKEIFPIDIQLDTKNIKLKSDESPRKNLTLETLNNLDPIFRKNGFVTVGNTPPLNDGAAALILMSSDKANELKLKPLAKCVGFSEGNVPPDIMGIGPIPAIRNILKRHNYSNDNIDFFEVNEAQAQQVLFCIKALNIDIKKVNIHGGAIAMGHPPGMTGARLILTSIYTMRYENKKRAICSQCAGGGTGLAVLIEKYN
ncbi:MAG: acetyl-CoA C-acyltransferase [Candidatus Lokiarchaeota archaeon]|nr:acetyl-CoA C-acyltransferase [Candidatus Lokiarchaeota archaeon]MBD3202012.1 acetyl-CoA C-acyltransferase [Candidatus Lokiarchaeota archaeon]